jgi:hypothetical protein
MSMCHKAFIFDYGSFDRELKLSMENAIGSNDFRDIEKYIVENLKFLKDPNEGDALSAD